jgi:hypothetical protein
MADPIVEVNVDDLEEINEFLLSADVVEGSPGFPEIDRAMTGVASQGAGRISELQNRQLRTAKK